MLRLHEIAKAFGETQALASASLALRRGEVHAVIGENGSGKSTLVKILAGVLSPDCGSLQVDGDPLDRIRNPRHARQLGIATVFQDVLTVSALSALDNVWLGGDGTLQRRFSDQAKRARAREVLDELGASEVELGHPAERLSLSQRQLLVIARALVQEPNVLILDESTSALDIVARERLFAAIAARCHRGSSVVFISHRMDEIEQLAHRITVLRSGRTVATLAPSDAPARELLRLMSERDVPLAERRRTAAPGGEAVLEVRGLRFHKGSVPIDLDLMRGEIVGVAGLEGHGQEAFIRAVCGIERPAQGSVCRLDAARRSPKVIRSQREAARAGIVYVPRDRKTEGVFEPLSIEDNFALPTMRADAIGIYVLKSRLRRRLGHFAQRLGLVRRSVTDRITSLSGGNQQKVLLSRWLATEPALFVLNDPTRGVDQATKEDIYGLLNELAQHSVTVLMLSTELEEHVALMDRVLVFREDGLFSELQGDDITREALIAAFFGRSAQGEVTARV